MAKDIFDLNNQYDINNVDKTHSIYGSRINSVYSQELNEISFVLFGQTSRIKLNKDEMDIAKEHFQEMLDMIQRITNDEKNLALDDENAKRIYELSQKIINECFVDIRKEAAEISVEEEFSFLDNASYSLSKKAKAVVEIKANNKNKILVYGREDNENIRKWFDKILRLARNIKTYDDKTHTLYGQTIYSSYSKEDMEINFSYYGQKTTLKLTEDEVDIIGDNFADFLDALEEMTNGEEKNIFLMDSVKKIVGLNDDISNITPEQSEKLLNVQNICRRILDECFFYNQSLVDNIQSIDINTNNNSIHLTELEQNLYKAKQFRPNSIVVFGNISANIRTHLDNILKRRNIVYTINRLENETRNDKIKIKAGNNKTIEINYHGVILSINRDSLKRQYNNLISGNNELNPLPIDEAEISPDTVDTLRKIFVMANNDIASQIEEGEIITLFDYTKEYIKNIVKILDLSREQGIDLLNVGEQSLDEASQDIPMPSEVIQETPIPSEDVIDTQTLSDIENNASTPEIQITNTHETDQEVLEEVENVQAQNEQITNNENNEIIENDDSIATRIEAMGSELDKIFDDIETVKVEPVEEIAQPEEDVQEEAPTDVEQFDSETVNQEVETNNNETDIKETKDETIPETETPDNSKSTINENNDFDLPEDDVDEKAQTEEEKEETKEEKEETDIDTKEEPAQENDKDDTKVLDTEESSKNMMDLIDLTGGNKYFDESPDNTIKYEINDNFKNSVLGFLKQTDETDVNRKKIDKIINEVNQGYISNDSITFLGLMANVKSLIENIKNNEKENKKSKTKESAPEEKYENTTKENAESTNEEIETVQDDNRKPKSEYNFTGTIGFYQEEYGNLYIRADGKENKDNVFIITEGVFKKNYKCEDVKETIKKLSKEKAKISFNATQRGTTKKGKPRFYVSDFVIGDVPVLGDRTEIKGDGTKPNENKKAQKDNEEVKEVNKDNAQDVADNVETPDEIMAERERKIIDNTTGNKSYTGNGRPKDKEEKSESENTKNNNNAKEHDEDAKDEGKNTVDSAKKETKEKDTENKNTESPVTESKNSIEQSQEKMLEQISKEINERLEEVMLFKECHEGEGALRDMQRLLNKSLFVTIDSIIGEFLGKNNLGDMQVTASYRKEIMDKVDETLQEVNSSFMAYDIRVKRAIDAFGRDSMEHKKILEQMDKIYEKLIPNISKIIDYDIKQIINRGIEQKAAEDKNIGHEI